MVWVEGLYFSNLVHTLNNKHQFVFRHSIRKPPLNYSKNGLSAGFPGPGARGRTRTGTELPPRDFKSLVSTNSTTRAGKQSKQWRLESESNRR